MFPLDASLEGHTFADVLGTGTLDHTSWMSNVGLALNSFATIYTALAPYNVSAAASGATNFAGITAALAAAASAGSAVIVLPAGVINFDGPAGTNTSVFTLHSNLVVVGMGTGITTLKFTGVHDSASEAMFATTAAISNVTFAHMTIHGNRAGRTADEHKCAFRLGAGGQATNVRFTDMEIAHNPGDAIFAIWTAGLRVDSCRMYDNGRCAMVPIASQGNLSTDTVVTRSYLAGDQNAVDMETDSADGSMDGAIFDDCIFDWGATGTIPFSISTGYWRGNTGTTSNVRINNCTIYGLLYIQGVTDMSVTGSRFLVPPASPTYFKMGIVAFGRNDRLVISNNVIDRRNDVRTTVFNAAIFVSEINISPGPSQPLTVTIENNDVRIFTEFGAGITCRAVKNVTIRGNRVRWDSAVAAGTGVCTGILIDGASGESPPNDAQTCVIRDNEIFDPRGKGIWVRHVAGDRVITHLLQIDRNNIIDDQASHTLTTGVVVDAGSTGGSCVIRNGTDNVVLSL